MGYRIGVDIGGTFTDFCVFDETSFALHTLKVLSRPAAPGAEVLQGLDEIERWANANNVKIMNIGDSVMARRIIDGVREGRNVLDALEDMGALGSREAQRIPFLTY